MKILNVDDRAANRYLLETLFRAGGYQVVSVSNGQEAIRKLESEPFDLIISDILMPQMDGFQLCRAAKSHPCFKNIPFIFYTATYTDEKDKEFGLGLGADRFLVKPEEPKKLLDIVEEVLRERKTREAPKTEIPQESDESYLKLYNTRLVGKLEHKVSELEKATRQLKAALEAKESEMARRLMLEDALRQSQKMESFGLLAGGVAHDFNNILQAILGQADYLSQLPESRPEARDALAVIESAGRHGTTMIRRLLTFASQRPTRRQNVDVRGTLREFEKLMGSVLGSRYSLLLDLGETSLETYVDVGLIEQALMNLVINARDAMPSGGEIRIETVKTLVGADHVRYHLGAREGDFVRIGVRDGGCGMAPETISKIFEPFFTTKPEGKGTGLGLSTVYGVVQSHKGWIEVESAIGKGTTFFLYLPDGYCDESQSPTTQAAAEQGLSSETVLLVSEQGLNGMVLSKHLKGLGYAVLEAHDLAGARDIWSSHNGYIHALVIDLSDDNPAVWKLIGDLKRDASGLKVICIHGVRSCVQERRVCSAGRNPAWVIVEAH